MAKLNTLNQTIEYVASDGNSAPADGATVTVHRAGATVQVTKTLDTTPATEIEVEGINTIRVGDTLQHGTDTGTTMVVTAVHVSQNKINVTAAVGFTATAGDRLIVQDTTVWLHLDEYGATKAASNVLTTNSLGKIQGYIELTQCDLIVAGAMFAATWVSGDVQVPSNHKVTPADFGATNAATDQLAIIQHAIDTLDAGGIDILWLDKFYYIDGEIELTGNFEIRGMSRKTTGFLQLKSTGATFWDNNTGGNKISNMAVVSTGGGTAQPFSFEDDVIIEDVDFSTFNSGGLLSPASGTKIINSTIHSVAVAVITDDTENLSIISSHLKTTVAGGVTLLIAANNKDVKNIYVGGGTLLTAESGAGTAIECQSNSTFHPYVTLAGVHVDSGAATFDEAFMSIVGFTIAPADLGIDSLTAKNSTGIVNNQLYPQRTDGDPVDSPPSNTYPMRFDPATNKVYFYNGTAWVGTTIGASTAETQQASTFVSTPAATTIATIGVYTKVLGTWAQGFFTSDFDNSVNNRIKYTGAVAKWFFVLMPFSMTSTVAPPNDDASFRIYRYNDDGAAGVTQAATQIDRNVSSSTSGALACGGIITLDTNDYIELWVTRASTNPVTVTEGQLMIIEIGIL